VDLGALASVAVPTQSDRIADLGSVVSVASQSQLESVAEALGLTSVAAFAQAERLADVGSFASVAVPTQAERIADIGALTSAALLAIADAVADRSDLVTIAVLTQSESLKDVSTVTTIVVPVQQWKRISSGLSGHAYDSTGTNPIAGAQVLVFDDDNNLLDQHTTDGSGYWFMEADPNVLYWISYWLDGATQLQDETERHIAPVDTIVESGT
jgi:hypothetical protein